MSALALPLLAGGAVAQTGATPHEWLYGSWTGGLFPANDTTSAACFAQPTVIFTRDVVMRTGIIDVGYRQRAIETVAGAANGVEFRLVPAAPSGTLSSRLPPDIGFNCAGNPNTLTVERRGPNEIAFPGCTDFPLTLRRCGAP
ncbi:MAG: hypothetical protein V4653_11640 [Pseudomonadota bacterium]